MTPRDEWLWHASSYRWLRNAGVDRQGARLSIAYQQAAPARRAAIAEANRIAASAGRPSQGGTGSLAPTAGGSAGSHG